jgi:FtsP/CotA-like multicopper oxidase with cupredoxin domain
MDDNFAMINGRGYPDTVNPGNLSHDARGALDADKETQRVSSVITATQGEKVLLRLSNLSVTQAFTLTALGLPLQIVGVDSNLHRGPDGTNLYYTTSSVTIGGGEIRDILVDTTDVAPGTYFIYTNNMNYLSNADEDYGGMMTEFVVEEAL